MDKSKDFFISIFAEHDTAQELLPLVDNEHFVVSAYVDPSQGLGDIAGKPCNLIIIELDATHDGFEIKKNARKINSSVNLIFVSRKRCISTVINSQRNGADFFFFLPLTKEDDFKMALSILYRRRNYWMDLIKSVSKGD